MIGRRCSREQAVVQGQRSGLEQRATRAAGGGQRTTGNVQRTTATGRAQRGFGGVKAPGCERAERRAFAAFSASISSPEQARAGTPPSKAAAARPRTGGRAPVGVCRWCVLPEGGLALAFSLSPSPSSSAAIAGVAVARAASTTLFLRASKFLARPPRRGPGQCAYGIHGRRGRCDLATLALALAQRPVRSEGHGPNAAVRPAAAASPRDGQRARRRGRRRRRCSVEQDWQMHVSCCRQFAASVGQGRGRGALSIGRRSPSLVMGLGLGWIAPIQRLHVARTARQSLRASRASPPTLSPSAPPSRALAVRRPLRPCTPLHPRLSTRLRCTRPPLARPTLRPSRPEGFLTPCHLEPWPTHPHTQRCARRPPLTLPRPRPPPPPTTPRPSAIHRLTHLALARPVRSRRSSALLVPTHPGATGARPAEYGAARRWEEEGQGL